MKDIPITMIKGGGYELTPGAKALLERVNHPNDLEDALLAVEVEAMAKKIAARLVKEIKKMLGERFQ